KSLYLARSCALAHPDKDALKRNYKPVMIICAHLLTFKSVGDTSAPSRMANSPPRGSDPRLLQ
ncbi:hypothetical protein, partial [Nostoc sp.]|uniref:hypothetical protein n=1 Tax=Nostoc sp. TaxID=1180 RepID=UPI002FF5DBAF